MCLANTPSGKWVFQEARHFMFDSLNQVMTQKRRRGSAKEWAPQKQLTANLFATLFGPPRPSSPRYIHCTSLR